MLSLKRKADSADAWMMPSERSRNVLDRLYSGLTSGGGVMLLTATLLMLLMAAPARADFSSSEYTYGDCGGSRVDPINFVWYGATAWASNSALHTEHHTGWSNTSGSSQVFFTHGSCRAMNAQRASGTYSRFHIRLFQTAHLDDKGRYETVGDAHHEDWVLSCPGHAVDANGANGSGFDQGKLEMFSRIYGSHHYYGANVYWGNTISMRQCDGDYAGSNGYVIWFGNNV